jgi:outer membrane protein, heavy metal efflux system
MVKLLRRALLLAASACCLQAQSGLSLSDAIRKAQSTHPLIRAARERVRAAEGNRVQADRRPNPRLTVQTENLRSWGSPAFSFPDDTDDFVTLSQVFEIGGKRSLRTELADTGIRAAQAEEAVEARHIAARVSLAYWSAAAAANLRDLLAQDLANFEQIVQYHRDRVREGAMAEVDLMRIMLERDRLNLTAQTASHEAIKAQIALLREIGSSDFRPVTLSDAITSVREFPAPDLAVVLKQRPEIQAARAGLEQARAGIGLERVMAKPDPEAMFGYKRTAGFDTLVASLQIDLPFARNQGAIAAAQARVRSAELNQLNVENQVRAEVAAAWAEHQARRRMVSEVLSPMRERADEIARIAVAAYREGGTDLLRLLDAERARIEALTMYYRALSDYQQSVTNLLIATGAPL